MHPRLERFASELRAAQQSLAQAEDAGDTDGAATIRERIATLEGEMRAVSARLDAMAVQSWHFDISRNAEGFIATIDASPIP